MRRMLFAALATLSAIALAACAAPTVKAPENGALRFGYAAEPYPPFAAPDSSGQWSGFEVDLMNAVCAKMNTTCTVVPVSWDVLIASLQAGKFDVIWASMMSTPQRE